MKIYRIKYIFIALLMSFAISNNAIANPIEKNVDHFEKWNRPVFEFNNILDKIILLPLSLVYRDFVPEAIKSPIEGIVSQFQYPVSAVNYALQADYKKSILAIKKLSVNVIVTMGTGNIILEEEKTLPYKQTTFNKTLKQQGLGINEYLVLPVLGGKTVRKHIGDVVDGIIVRTPGKIYSTSASAIITRSKYIDILQTMEDTSLDYYSAVRNITLQREMADDKSDKPQNNFQNFDFSDEEL